MSGVTTRVDLLDHAMILNAVMSLSLDFVLLVISVRRAGTLARYDEFGPLVFCWNLCAKLLQDSRREGILLHMQLVCVVRSMGDVRLEDALATFACCTVDAVGAGDHTVADRAHSS